MYPSEERLAEFTKQVLTTKRTLELAECRFVGWCLLLGSGFLGSLAFLLDCPATGWSSLVVIAAGAYLVRQGRPRP